MRNLILACLALALAAPLAAAHAAAPPADVLALVEDAATPGTQWPYLIEDHVDPDDLVPRHQWPNLAEDVVDPDGLLP